MKPPRRTHPFNIVEIAIALAITAFAMASLMAIFPMGFAINRDTIAQNYASDMGDQVLGYIQNSAGSDWNSTFSSGKWNQGRQPQPDLTGTPTLINTGTGPNSNPNATLESYGSAGSNYKSFRITRSSTVAGTQLTEMAAIAQLWCPDISVSGQLYHTVFIEISWPESSSYTSRKKLFLCKQIFNPN